MAQYGGRIVVHRLPAYSPERDPIERLWKRLHDGLTRNHRLPAMKRLMGSLAA